MDQAELTVTDHGKYVLVKTHGPLNDATGDSFRAHVHHFIGRDDTQLIVDISESQRINSAGIASLVRLVTEGNSKNCRVIIAAPTRFVANVFRVTRLARFFEIVDTVAEAQRCVEHES